MTDYELISIVLTYGNTV